MKNFTVLAIWRNKLTVEYTNGQEYINHDLSMGSTDSDIFETMKEAFEFRDRFLDFEEAESFQIYQIGQALSA